MYKRRCRKGGKRVQSLIAQPLAECWKRLQLLTHRDKSDCREAFVHVIATAKGSRERSRIDSALLFLANHKLELVKRLGVLVVALIFDRHKGKA